MTQSQKFTRKCILFLTHKWYSNWKTLKIFSVGAWFTAHELSVCRVHHWDQFFYQCSGFSAGICMSWLWYVRCKQQVAVKALGCLGETVEFVYWKDNVLAMGGTWLGSTASLFSINSNDSDRNICQTCCEICLSEGRIRDLMKYDLHKHDRESH